MAIPPRRNPPRQSAPQPADIMMLRQKHLSPPANKYIARGATKFTSASGLLSLTSYYYLFNQEYQ
jgi:hypothetical protein